MTVGGDERRSGIKPYVRIPGDHWVRSEPTVGLCVFYDKDLRLKNPVRAKGDIARGPTHRRPDFGFEPLPIFTHQTNRGDFGPANLGSQKGDIVKGLFWTGIEDIVSAQRLEPLRFVGWQRSDHWTKSVGAPDARYRFTIFNINIIFVEIITKLVQQR